MSYLNMPNEPYREDDDDPSTNTPAAGRVQTFHSIKPMISSTIPEANTFPQNYNLLGKVIGAEPDTSGYGHCHYDLAPPVTDRQQQYGGQHPRPASSLSPSALSDSRHPHGPSSVPRLHPHQRHLDGIQKAPSDAQGDWRRAAGSTQPHFKADRGAYAQGSMPGNRRNAAASRMLHANTQYLGYWNIGNTGQDDRSVTHTAISNANDGRGDVRSTKKDSGSSPKPWQSATMPFDGNTTMNRENTNVPGNPWSPIRGILSRETNAPLQTPRVNTGYEPSGVPNYNQRTFDPSLEAYTPNDPLHQPLQPWRPMAQGLLNNEGRYLDSTSASTQDQLDRRNIGIAHNNAHTLPYHPRHVTKRWADQRSETHPPFRTMPSPSGLLPSFLGGATDQTDAVAREPSHTQYPELAIPDVVEHHLPASGPTSIRESASSNVAPRPSHTKRKRSQSSSSPGKRYHRKERKLAPLSDYERSKKAFVRRENLACDRCKAQKTGCKHWDQGIFRSQYEASNAPNTPTSDATAPETRRAVRRPRPPASNRAIAPSRQLETTQTLSSPTLLAYPGQTECWGNTMAQIGGRLDVPVGLTSPVSAAAVLQGQSRHQRLAKFDTMTHAALESMHGSVRPIPTPFTAGETPSQETAVMQMGMHFGSHTNIEQHYFPSNLFSELDVTSEPQPELPILNYDSTLLSPRDSDYDDELPHHHPGLRHL